ncbi:MAG: sulfite dehydrogenase [Acidobacteria bacterium]|nr:sulfite dehydrogenase [Acidobacteriota bacterium]
MKVTRRDLIAGAAGAVALARTAGAQTPADPTKVRGTPPRALGDRASTARVQRIVRGQVVSSTPLHDLMGIITPSDLHFERHHGGVPAIAPETYSLLIHGMVERPTIFTLADLKRFPSHSQIHFLECSGNLGRTAGPETTPGMLAGLTSTSEWTGVRLSTLLGEVGVRSGARWLLAEGADAAVLTRSVPIEKALDDALVAYGQNGEALRPEQGYPARLFLPGWEGNASVKWLRRLEVSDQPFMTREETSKYTEPFANGTSRQFSFRMDARSLITAPAFPNRLERGWVEITGIAWTGAGRITRVDISTDGGATWAAARLQEPVLPLAHTRFRHMWQWNGGEAVLMSRAVDETGYMQPTKAELLAQRGPGTATYHLNPITGWVVQPDGRVVYKEESWA